MEGIIQILLLMLLGVLLLVNDIAYAVFMAWFERKKNPPVMSMLDRQATAVQYQKQQCEKGKHDFSKWSPPYQSSNGYRQKRVCRGCNHIEVGGDMYFYRDTPDEKEVTLIMDRKRGA